MRGEVVVSRGYANANGANGCARISPLRIHKVVAGDTCPREELERLVHVGFRVDNINSRQQALANSNPRGPQLPMSSDRNLFTYKFAP